MMTRPDTRRWRPASAVGIILMIHLSGCLGDVGSKAEDDDGQQIVPFPSFVSCQLEFPDGTPVDCNGTAAPFVELDDTIWLCAWDFHAGGYDGWLSNSADLQYGAVRLRGDPPAPQAMVAITLLMDSGQVHEFAGPWTKAEQVFAFPRPADGSGHVYITGSVDLSVTVDNKTVPHITHWTSFDGLPSPITTIGLNGSDYSFHQFQEITILNATRMVPQVSFVVEENAILNVSRSQPIVASSRVGGASWGPSGCIDGM